MCAAGSFASVQHLWTSARNLKAIRAPTSTSAPPDTRRTTGPPGTVPRAEASLRRGNAPLVSLPTTWHSGSGSFCCVSNPGTCAPTGSNVLTTMSPAFHLRQIVEPCPAPCTVFTNAAAATGVVDSCAKLLQGRGRFRGLGLGTYVTSRALRTWSMGCIW